VPTRAADGFFHPCSEAQLVALVELARERRCPLRVRGSAHSIAPAILTDARLEGRSLAIDVMLDRYTRIAIDAATSRVTVEAGCHLGLDPRDPTRTSTWENSLLAALDAQGLALPDLGGVTHQTVSGFLMTGSSGGTVAHAVEDAVVTLRLIDGRGQIHELTRGRDELFDAAICSMGLLGVISTITLQCVPRYDVIGREDITTEEGCAYELCGDGATGLADFFRRAEYARLMWWPQRGVERVVTWQARRMRDDDYTEATGPRGALRKKPYSPFGDGLSPKLVEPLSRASQWVGGKFYDTIDALGYASPVKAERATIYSRHVLPTVLGAFVALDQGKPQRFWDAWFDGLPMDNGMSEESLPTTFTELWVPLADAARVMRALRDHFRARGLAATGNYIFEIYAARATRGWLHPSYERDSLRIDVFWFERSKEDATRFFEQFWDLLAPFGYRLHWGKHLPRDAARGAEYLRKQYPRWDDFLRVREELDPLGVFLNQHFRAALGIDAEPAGARKEPSFEAVSQVIQSSEPRLTSSTRQLRPRPLVNVGLGRADITACAEGMSMWGWGSNENVPVGVAAPLHARALVISDSPTNEAPIVFVTVELGMASEALRRASLDGLRARGVHVDEHRFSITATHTHSGPSGFSTYLFYSMAGPGFSSTLLDKLAAGVVDAVILALRSLAPSRIFKLSEDLPLASPVAFNRSVEAYNRNRDVTPIRVDRADEGVRRAMTVLRIESDAGQARGLLAIFALHGTSIHSDNDLLHPDNSGVAASTCERDAGRDGTPDFVAIFAQGAAGDVSPNYRWDARRGLMIGRFDDDFESATWSGETQARHAMQLARRARVEGEELHGPFESSLRYVPFDRTVLDADQARAAGCEVISSARLGVGFALGTAEGPGPLRRTPRAAQALARACVLFDNKPDPTQAPKPVAWDLGGGAESRIAGRFHHDHPALGLVSDRRVEYYRGCLARGEVLQRPWVPHHLPFQILRLGSFAMALISFEPTTVAGRRIQVAVTRALAPIGVQGVEVLGYANAYASYLTTPEEYDAQAYEGATTLFGRGSLGAVCTRLREVARAMIDGRPMTDGLEEVQSPSYPLRTG
jgi:D-arabinono-1,4-lactone oxidase